MLLLDVARLAVLRVWKSYRSCQLGWLAVPQLPADGVCRRVRWPGTACARAEGGGWVGGGAAVWACRLVLDFVSRAQGNAFSRQSLRYQAPPQLSAARAPSPRGTVGTSRAG